MGISSKNLNSKPLTVLFIILLIIPFLFIKQIKKYFTRKVIVQLNNNNISFSIKKLNNDEEEQFKDYPLLAISSYKIQFPTNDFISLTIKLNSKKQHEFSFRKNFLNDIETNAESLIETIHKTFEQNKIEFVPAFFATKKGLYTIIFLITLSCVPFGMAIYLNKNLPATIFISIAIILQIISRRVSDLNLYKKWKKM